MEHMTYDKKQNKKQTDKQKNRFCDHELRGKSRLNFLMWLKYGHNVVKMREQIRTTWPRFTGNQVVSRKNEF